MAAWPPNPDNRPNKHKSKTRKLTGLLVMLHLSLVGFWPKHVTANRMLPSVHGGNQASYTWFKCQVDPQKWWFWGGLGTWRTESEAYIIIFYSIWAQNSLFSHFKEVAQSENGARKVAGAEFIKCAIKPSYDQSFFYCALLAVKIHRQRPRSVEPCDISKRRPQYQKTMSVKIYYVKPVRRRGNIPQLHRRRRWRRSKNRLWLSLSPRWRK